MIYTEEGYTAQENESEVIEGHGPERDNGHQRERGVPTRVYARTPLYFSENKDDRMEWADIEPYIPSYPARRTTIRKISYATRLEKVNRTLRKKIIDLQLALKCHKQKLRRAIAAKVRAPKAAETVDEFLDRKNCLNKVSRTMVKLQLKKDNATYTTEEQDLTKMIFYRLQSTNWTPGFRKTSLLT